MKTKFMLFVAVMALLFSSAGVSYAADWTTTRDGLTTASFASPGKSYWLTDISETSAVLDTTRCETATFVVWGGSASLTPQACDDSSCTNIVPLTDTALTGETDGYWLATVTPWAFMRVLFGSAPRS